MPKNFKIIHTSDWHLGKTLCGKNRYEEHRQFLRWLGGLIKEHSVNALLLAGDIFDTPTPSNQAQELYYNFLSEITRSPCRHVVITAGNHDSPTFLNAPREILKKFDIHVLGSISDNPADEVILLKDPEGLPEGIVCAVPFLRDRDVRTAEAGETPETKDQKLLAGIRAHFNRVIELAKNQRAEINSKIPLIVMGHLFTAGGHTSGDDGVRELYVGSLAHIEGSLFPSDIDYVALGHLHVPQKVGGRDTVRYSGSPIPMGFGEAGQQKSICLVEFFDPNPVVQTIEIPCFQELHSFRGDTSILEQRTQALLNNHRPAWVELILEGNSLPANPTGHFANLVKGSEVEILRLKTLFSPSLPLSQTHSTETLTDLNPQEVFERCLTANEIVEEEKTPLRVAFRVILSLLQEEANPL